MERFKAHGDGTISDPDTGLMWQQEDDSVERSWNEASSYCSGLRLGGHNDWRLPTLKELTSLFHSGLPRNHPAAFLNAKDERYWSSEPYYSAREPNRNFAYVIDFRDGRPMTYYAEYKYYVRAVRDGPRASRAVAPTRESATVRRVALESVVDILNKKNLPGPASTPMFLELQQPMTCPRCQTTSVRYRQLRDGRLHCLACSRSFEDDSIWFPDIKRLGEDAVDPLVSLLMETSHEESIRKKAARALGELGNARAVHCLIGALDQENQVAQEATKALIKLGAVAVDALIQALQGFDYRERYALRERLPRILGEIGDQRAVEPLILALHDEFYEVRKNAAEALGKVGDLQALDPLVAVLEDREFLVASSAAEALGELGDPKAVAALTAALGRKGAVSSAAASALKRIGGPEAEQALANYHEL